MQREFPAAPVVGVGAVVLDDARRVLLVRRARAPLAGEWSLPGGVLELGERLEDGVRREVQEETGLEVEPIQLVTVFDHIAHTAGADAQVQFHYVIVDFRCHVTGGSLMVGDDASAARWAAWSELTGHGAIPLQPFTLSVIRKALEQAEQGSGHAEESRTVRWSGDRQGRSAGCEEDTAS